MTDKDLRAALDKPARDYGLRALAAKLGVTQPWLSMWLAGKRFLPLATLHALAGLLGYRLEIRLRKIIRKRP